MPPHPWVQELAGGFTVCDPDGIILEMNDKAMRTFQDHGGTDPIGTNMLDCHFEPARSETRERLDSRRTNVYTIEKRGQKKLIFQVPWYQDGRYRGFVDLSLEFPAEMPHSVREP